MLGGNRHGVLGDLQKGGLVKHVCGNVMHLDKLDLINLMN